MQPFAYQVGHGRKYVIVFLNKLKSFGQFR